MNGSLALSQNMKMSRIDIVVFNYLMNGGTVVRCDPECLHCEMIACALAFLFAPKHAGCWI